MASTAAPAPEFLSFAEARKRVMAAVRPLPSERVPLDDALGRALESAIRAPHALPPFANSAMDGVVVRAADLASASEARPVTLEVIATIAAGHPAKRALQSGEAMRIMTGAPLPAGADAVVPVEDGERAGGADAEWARLRHAPAPGEHVRPEGADLAAGELALEEGRELSAYDLALLAALGVAEVPVARAPRVAVLSTGDELLDPDQPLVTGAIRDSNLPMLALLAEQAGAQVVVAERLPDDPERVAARIGEALAVADVVLTIGGVSAGDFDPVKLALARVGGVETWRVAMRPGRPQASGAPGGRLFHGLPGNPASVACVFETLVRPALRRMQGHARLDRPRLAVRAARAIESRPGRTDFVRCTLEWRDGAAWAAPAGAQVSGHLTPQSRAHALVVVPEAAPGLAAGEAAEALVLRLPER